jgi:hypothetical protein
VSRDTRAGRRRRWHPVPVGTGLLLVSGVVAAATLAGAPVLPLAWLLTGAAAGFATSGST